MNVNSLVGVLDRNKVRISKILSANNWGHFRRYCSICDKYRRREFNDQFKHDFCYFYVMNGARGLNPRQKKVVFRILKTQKTSLSNILKKLYKIPSYEGNHKLYLSFGSKILHTINHKLPIYDGNVASVLKLTKSNNQKSFESRLENRVYIYDELKRKFNKLLRDKRIKEFIKSIRKKIIIKKPDKCVFKVENISDAKILDSSLWALYLVLNTK